MELDELFLIKEIESIENLDDLKDKQFDNYEIHFPYDWIIELIIHKRKDKFYQANIRQNYIPFHQVQI